MDRLKRALIEDKRYHEGIKACLAKPAVLVAPTNYCNFACTYCSTRDVDNAKVNMDPALAKSIIDQCVEHGWRLTFGQTYEPFLHPRIVEIIEHAGARGTTFSSSTNAMAIRREAFDLPMNLIVSFSADEHDYGYRGSALSYGKYRQKIMDFLAHRIQNDVSGAISLQIADYSIYGGDMTYDKEIKEIEAIIRKSLDVAQALGLTVRPDEDDWRSRVAARLPLVLHQGDRARIQVQPTKIMPNSYDAFVDLPSPDKAEGYCDSCYTMMSIQAGGEVAVCCCDPSAKVIAGRINAQTDLKEFWLGPNLDRIRKRFQEFRPLHPFCTQCLANVTEKIKPLLTVSNPALVADILRDHGVAHDLPWFSFPKSS